MKERKRVLFMKHRVV